MGILKMAGEGKPWGEEFGIFKCFDAPIMCLWSWCLPFGGNCMQCVDANHTTGDGIKAFICSWCLCCIGAGMNRKALREHFKLEGGFLMDCLCHWFCGCCAVTQEFKYTMKEVHSDPKKFIWQVFSHKKS